MAKKKREVSHYYEVRIEIPTEGDWEEFSHKIEEAIGESDGSGTGMGTRELVWEHKTLPKAMKGWQTLHSLLSRRRKVSDTKLTLERVWE